MNLKEKIKSIIPKSVCIPDEFDSSDLAYCIQENVIGWPEQEGELLDLENNGIAVITNEHLIMYGGGDWQTPCKLEIKLNDNNELYVNHVEMDVFDYGMESEEIFEILNIDYE